MPRILEKTERRLGERLLLKGIRCAGPKCAAVRRGYPPGVHGKKRVRKRAGSEYGELLREKQKVRFLYGLDDRDIARYSKKAAQMPGIFNSSFLSILERRLDNAIFRLGLAESRRIARQLVNHGHVTVNGKRVTIPSYRVRVGDTIALKERIFSIPLFHDFDARIKGYEPPQWLLLDKAHRSGKIIRLPGAEDTGAETDVIKIKEFYSR